MQHLLFTFFLSLFLTGLLYIIWFNSTKRGFEEGQAMTLLLAIGNLFQNVILALAALPVLQLSKEKIYNDVPVRRLYYFSGPVLLTSAFVLFVGNSAEDKIGFLLPGLSFIAIHSYFYFKLIKEKANNQLNR